MDIITVDELKAELPNQDYETLTLGEDSIAERCIQKAEVWIKAMVKSTGKTYDQKNTICKEATLKRALYELFSFVGMGDRAREKLEDSELLIESYFGPIIKKTDTDSKGPAYGLMTSRRDNPLKRSSEWV